MTEPEEISRFRAMGTEITLIGPETAGARVAASAAAAVAEVFAGEELRYSRFRADSELSLVNASAGSTVHVSARFADLVALALGWAERTDGSFDPTVLTAMIAAGYDRDFDEMLAGARGTLHPTQPCGRWREIRLEDRDLRLPDGAGLDLGGIAKGWTADLAADTAVGAGLPWALVNAGGDLSLKGDAPGLTVGIEDPGAPELECARLTIRSGGIATSSTMSRSWGEDLHHLIDPRTGSPSTSDVVQATVWAPTCADAEVLAKLVVLSGSSAVTGIPAAVVTVEGDLLLSRQMLEGAAA